MEFVKSKNLLLFVVDDVILSLGETFALRYVLALLTLW